jgi:hypothetical protein
MSDLSAIHWLLVLLVMVLLIVPYWKIFPRAGWPGPLALLMLVPLLNLILLWVLAFKQWPGDEKTM